MRHDPADPHWPGRDRFVLSCGHSSLTLYIQLYLGGFGLELDDLKALRTWGSQDPGPPGVRPHQRRGDHHRPAGPGPRQRGRHGDGRPPRARPARPGRRTRRRRRSTTTSTASPPTATSRRASPPRRPRWPATQQLGNLTLIYDNNHISIEDDTNIALTEDTAARYEAYGWHVQTVDWTHGDTQYVENVAALHDAIEAAKRGHRPAELHRACARSSAGRRRTCRTPARPHGSALGDDEVAATKKVLGFDPEQDLRGRRRGHRAHPRAGRPRAAGRSAEWQSAFDAWAAANPEGKALLRPAGRRRAARRLGGRAAQLVDADPKGSPPAPPPARC